MIRPTLAALAVTALLSLAACHNGNSSSSIPSTTTSTATQLRLVHGSPDAGNVDIGLDTTLLLTNVAYGSISTYAGVTAGPHTLYVYPAGNDSTAAAVLTYPITFSTGALYSVAITGEVSPKTGSKNLAVTTFTDTPFASTALVPDVNYHDASPVATSLANPLPFGVSLLSAPTNFNQLTTGSFGTESGPISLPSTFVNTGVTFYAVSATGGITELPSAVDPNDPTNVMTTTADTNLSLYLVDGPGASVTPTSTITGIDMARWIGVFDANGT